MKNNLVAYINGKAYEVVSGAIYAEEFNETLDSLSIVIDNVSKENRIELNPYDFVRVKNISEDSEAFPFNVEMLVDNFVESEESISQHIYKYSINLMSETKLLEKVQCPNLAITHSLKKGKKSVYTHIKRYYDLYAPKVKMVHDAETWAYTPIFSLSPEIKEKFKEIACADMAMQQPTLRQVFTNLMLQASCIPVIKNRVLSYIDLAEEPKIFMNYTYGFNKTQRSNSSDSYVNALASMKDQLLDTGNKVISETLGFRDKDNVLIKQAENLKLETAFPIYSISKCTMRIPCQISSTFAVDNINYASADPTLPSFVIKREGSKLKFIYAVTEDQDVPSVEEAFITFYEGVYVVKETVDVTSGIFYNQWKEVAIPSGLVDSDYFYFYSKMSDGRIIATRLCQLGTSYVDNIGTSVSFQNGAKGLYGYIKTDITPNVVENTKRKLLDTDFTTMPNTTNQAEIAKWIYGTVGYSIGSKTITGFSQTYSRAQGWWDEKKTYFENIINLFVNGSYYPTSRLDPSIEQSYREWLGGYKGALMLAPIQVTNTFASTIFDIEYQPLNSLTLKVYKDETPLELEQLDGTSQGLTDFDRFSDNLQQKVDRFGNDVMVVNQTTPYADTLSEVNSEKDGYICFKRTLAITNNYVQANYTLSKYYVIKNYFTSITTKYRAYEHVDYNQSTLRKEHRHTFVTLDKENHPNETDLFSFNNAKETEFFRGLVGGGSAIKPIKYAFERSNNESGSLELVKYDTSVVTCDSSFLLSFESPDNIGAGSYLKSPNVDESLGGVTQSYQIWGEDYNEKHVIGFIDELPFYGKTDYSVLATTCKTPIITSMNDYANSNSKIVLQESKLDGTTIYKDVSERINMTAQFIYANKAKDVIEFNGEIIRECPYVGNSSYGSANDIAIITRDEDKQLYSYPNRNGLVGLAKLSDLIQFGENNEIHLKAISCLKGMSSFKDNYYKIVHSYTNSEGLTVWKDIALVKLTRENTATLYVYLNDTNTQKIFGVDESGTLRLMYKDNGNGNRGYKPF